jgi:hypothetical protein
VPEFAIERRLVYKEPMPADPNYKELTVPVAEVERTVSELAPEWIHETTLDVVDVVGEPVRRVRLVFRKKST